MPVTYMILDVNYTSKKKNKKKTEKKTEATKTNSPGKETKGKMFNPTDTSLL